MSNKKDLLIEIGTEDLPARLLLNLSKEFGDIICDQLAAAELSFSKHKVFCTPRRLAVIVEDLDISQQDRLIERKGPPATSAFDKNGDPTQAAMGFARSYGIELSQLEFEKKANDPRLIYREQRTGLNTTELLPQLLETTISKLSIPKRMRWNETTAEFIRPVRWLLVIFGSDMVAANLFGQVAGNVTYGHRFHSPKPIVVKHASAYKELLQVKGHVLADFEERQKNILEQVDTLAAKVNGKPAYTQELLDEITSLVEWPHALLGDFDTRFLKIHKEVLISTMQDNQKYIPLLNDSGELLPHFIIISNIDSTSPEVVKQGNEKVIVPRFEDAMFFWQRDKNQPLGSRLEKLKSVVFEKQLGSLYDKTQRIIKLTKFLNAYTDADAKCSKRAAELSKCDLLTEMVGEFPKLQGIVGRNLALHDAEDKDVWLAIEEQYLPRHAGDDLPATAVGKTLALADRMDTLIGIFAIGKKPTGLKDPYGLRRASLAVLRIIIEKQLNIDLHASLKQAASLFPENLNANAVVDEVFDYIIERLRAYFSSRNVAPDVIDSVLANRPTYPNDIAARIEALCSFRKLPNAQSLAAANKRIRNILKKTEHSKIGQVQKELFKEDAESALHMALEELSSDVESLFQRHEYEQALNKLANLRQPVDTFFDDVMVMDEDEALKTNRIALLAKIDSLFMHVADFSRLQS